MVPKSCKQGEGLLQGYSLTNNIFYEGLYAAFYKDFFEI